MSIADLIKAAGRELAMREVVYPHRVQDGKMKEEAARREIQSMSAIIAVLKTVANEPALLLKLTDAGILTRAPEPEQRELPL